MKKMIALIVVACVLTTLAIPVNARVIPWHVGDAFLAPDTLVEDVKSDEVIVDAKYDVFRTGDGIEVDGCTYYTIVLGDLNGDAVVNSTDFMRIRNAYLGLYDLGEYGLLAADINGDGKINSTDYMLARRHFLGMQTITQEESVIFNDRPATAWHKYVSKYSDYAAEVFPRDEIKYNYQYDNYKDYFKNNNDSFEANYSGVEDFENYIDMISSYEYNSMDVWKRDSDTLNYGSTVHTKYMQKYLDLLNKIEFAELSPEDMQEYYEKYETYKEGPYGPYEDFTLYKGYYYLYGDDAVFEAPMFFLIMPKENPFECGITFNYGGQTFIATNYEDVIYDFYEIFAILYYGI